MIHLAKTLADQPYALTFPNITRVRGQGHRQQLPAAPMSTSPYKFQSYQLNKQLTLVPNPQWNPATDPYDKQLASKIIVNLNVNQADIDNRLLAGDVQVDAQALGLGAAAKARVLATPTLKANSDAALPGAGGSPT